ncbi:hypothetical protein BKA62DRAFT_833358 [Auriculariales sp. MPI-PUGE-AT-0066]|nr:hypothetical protein BKA62DRAFT_833358 [Auriculariales sp. MPI-PUGE-AT-0066]
MGLVSEAVHRLDLARTALERRRGRGGGGDGGSSSSGSSSTGSNSGSAGTGSSSSGTSSGSSGPANTPDSSGSFHSPSSAGGSQITASPYQDGSTIQYQITTGPYAGRKEGGGTRIEVEAEISFGSGYNVTTEDSDEIVPGVAGKNFPYYFYPIVWKHPTRTTPQYLYGNEAEYGGPTSSTRPGGALQMLKLRHLTDSTANHTFFFIADSATVSSLMPKFASLCSVATPLSAQAYSGVASDPQPEQAIRYYRGSSAVLTNAGYNNQFVLQDPPNALSIESQRSTAQMLSFATQRLVEAAAAAAYAEALEIAREEAVFAAPRLTSLTAHTIVTDAIYAGMRKLMYQHNKMQCINRIPAELLINIFHLLDVPSSRVNLALACRQWHDIVFKTPSLWATIDLSGPRDIAAGLAPQLQLSGTAPLNLSVRITDSNWEEICPLLPLALERCVILTLVLWTTNYHRLNVRAAICAHAPVLAELNLLDPDFVLDGNGSDNPDPLFNGSPLLETLRLKTNINFMRKSHYAEFTNVKQCLFSMGNSDWTIHDIQRVFDLFPNARRLAVEVNSWQESTPWTVTVPTQLHLLSIISTNSHLLPHLILRHLDRREIRRLCLSYNVRPAVGCARQVLWLILEDIPEPKCVRIEASAHPLSDRCVLDSPIASGIPDGIFATITHLYIGELILPLADPELPVAPVLEELTIQTMVPAFQSVDGTDSIFFLPRTRDCLLQCPKLRILRFAARSADAKQCLVPAMIRDFVEWHLEFDAERLQCLKLLGVELIQSFEDEVVGILQLFEDVDIEPGMMVWQAEELEPIQW